MKKIAVLLSNPCVWYLLIWCIYYLQGIIYSEGSFISRLSLLAIFVISAGHAYRTIQMPGKPVFFRGLNALVLMFTIYGLFLFLTDGTTTHGKVQNVQSMLYLKSYYMALLPIYSCYYYARKGYLNKDVLSLFAVIFVALGIANYYRMQRETLEYLASLKSDRTEITNNIGYVMLSVIPSLLIFNKKPLWQYIGIGFCVVFILMAMKRGAILCAGLFLVAFVWHKMKSSRSSSRRILVIAAIIVGFYLLAQFVENMLTNSDYFLARLEQTRAGDASGRESMYNEYFNHYFFDAEIIPKLIGYGANGTIKVFENYAHNDWLETLIDQGFVGIIIFCFYISCFLKTIRMRTLHPESKFALKVIFLLFILQTFFSAGITNTTIYTCCMFGYALNNGFAKDCEQLDRSK